MNEEILNQLYANARQHFSLPDFETFKVDMQDEEMALEFRESLTQYFDMPEAEVFLSDIGFGVEQEPVTSTRADVRKRDLKKKDSESLLEDGFSEQSEQPLETSVRAEVREGDLERAEYEPEMSVPSEIPEEPISIRAQTRESDLERIEIIPQEEEAEALLKERKMEVLDLALQLPTFDFEELNEDGQQIITEMASKYDLSPSEFLKEAKDKKQAVVDSDFGDWLKNSFKTADLSLGEMVATLPSSIYEFVGAAFSDPINRALGLPETDVEAFKELIGTKSVIEGLVKEQEYREKQDALYRREKGLEGGIVEAFQEGNNKKGIKLLTNAIVQSAPISLGIMAASASGVGLIPLATGATALMTGPELRKQLENNPGQAKALSVLKAVGMAGAEMVFSTITQGTLAKVYKDIIFKQGKKEGAQAFKNIIIAGYEAALKKFGPIAAGAGEAVEEVATQITQNLIEGKPVFQGVPDAAVTGFASGGVYGAPITAIQATKYANEGVAKWKIKNKIKKSEYSDIVGVFETQDITELQFDLADTKRADEILTAELKRRVDTGEMTKEDSDRIQQNFFETSIYKARLEPKNLTTEQKVKAINLLKEKKSLVETIKTIDEKSLSIEEQKRVDEINTELAELVTITETIKTEEDAISKQSPEGVDVQEQARDGEELGEGDTSGELTGPLTPKEDESTEFPEEEITQLTKEKALKNLKEKQKALRDLEAQIVEDGKGSPSIMAFDKARREINKAKAELDKLINKPKEEVTELTEEQKDEVSDLEYSLGLKPKETKNTQGGTAVQEKLDDNLTYTSSKKALNDKLEQSYIDSKDKVIKAARAAAKAIKTLLPDTVIELYDDTGVYNIASDYRLGTNGNYDNLTRNIQINVSSGNVSVVAHEVFHALLDAKLKEGAITIKGMVDSLRKVLPPDSDLIKRIDEFAELYEDDTDVRNEERLAELMGIMASEDGYRKLSKPDKNKIVQFLKKLAKQLGLKINLNEFTKTDEDVINLFNTLSGKISKGEEIVETDVEVLQQPSLNKEQEQGSGGQVGTFNFGKKESRRKAPSIETDTRDYASLIQDRDLKDFQGQSFVTNMYDFTNAGPTEIAPGIVLQLDGGKSYVPMMMERQGLKLGDKSNLAAFNSKENAESFARNAQGANSNLFAPHVGTKEGSWQFQQNLLEQLTDAALNNNILTDKELINTFNEGLKSKDGIKAFNIFKKRLGKNIKNLNSFINNPTSLIELLDINNNYSPDLRKILNDKLSANKKYQERIGVKNKLDFVSKFEDPLNKGSQGGDLVGLINFDNNTFEISKSKKGDVDYHPSFAYTIKANINGIYQPTEFYQSNDATETYAKYNKKGKNVSEKSKVGEEKFRTSNVSSSAGAIPKVGKVANIKASRTTPIEGDAITIEGVIEQGRAQGFSDASIKAVLQGRGFKAADINPAMELALKKGEALPSAFQNIEGGVDKGLKLFRSIQKKINEFKKNNKVTKAKVRAKAQEILKNTDAYKSLSEFEKNELLVALDRTLETRANRTIQKEITRIKNIIRGYKKGVTDLRSAQIELKNFIRNALPVSQGYSQNDIADTVALVTNIKSKKDFPAAVEKILKKVETARERKKKSLITKLQKFVSSKAKVISTGSKRRKSKGLDSQGQQFFAQVNAILKAALGSNAINKMSAIANELSNIEKYNEIIAKEARGEKLSVKDSKFLDKSIAFEMFADIKDKSLEDVQVLFEDLQSGAEISRQVIKEKRIRKAEADAKLKEEATSQIQKDFSMLFKLDKDGKKVLKTINDVRDDIKEINKSFAKLKIWEGLKKVYENYDFTVGKSISSFFKNYIAHLGSLTRILDNYSSKGFFQKQVYDRLNIMSENSLRGNFYQQEIIDSIANSIEGVEGGYSGILEILQQIGVKEITKRKRKVEYTADQIMRMYALSLNDFQRERLNNEGIKNIEEIKDILGPELVSFTDKIVEYLSNDYFEGLNDVYSDVNDTNLGYVENYFPTKSISDLDQAKLIEGDFNSVLGLENASALKERNAKDKELELNFGFSYTLENYISSMERYKSYAKGTRELNTIFQTPAVKLLTSDSVLAIDKLIKSSINFEINPTYGLQNQNKDNIGKFLNWFTSYVLSFKLIQIPKQSTSFVNAYSEYQFRKGKYTPVIDTLGFMVDYALTLANFRTNLKKMKEVSATFRNRLEKGMEGDIYSLESGGILQYVPEASAKGKKIRKNFKKAAASPTVLGDVFGIMGYVANYNRNIKNGMSEQEAVKVFNDYNATQQSRRNTEKSPIQRAKGYTRVFTAFGSTLYLQMNKVAIAQRNIFAKHIMKGKVPPTKDVRDLALNLSVANMLFVATSNIARLWAGDDEDRKEVYLAIAEAGIGLNLLYQLPLIGAAAEAGIQRAEVGLGLRKNVKRFDGLVNPFMSLWYKLSRFIKNPSLFSAGQGIVEIILGVQIDPAVGVINLFKDMEANEEEIYDISGISKSYRPSERKAPKRKKSTID